MRVVTSEELARLTGRGSADHTVSDYLYEIGRGAMTGVGRGVWDRYLAGLDDTAQEDLFRRMQEIRAERLREHPLGGTTGGKLLQAGGEMLPLMLAGEILPAAMLMRKGVGLGSIAKGLIPGTKVAMPSLRLGGVKRIASASLTGTIIGGAERKLQEPDASVGDVAKNALVQGAWWGAGESLAVAVGALVKKFGAQRGLVAHPDEEFVRRAESIFAPLDKGELPLRTPNSESVLATLGVNKSMLSELGDKAWWMGRHKLRTGRLPLPQTRLLKGQKVPQGTVDMGEVWILGMDKKGNNIYNGMPLWSPAKRADKTFIRSTHMYGVGEDIHHIKWVNTDLNKAIVSPAIYTEEQLAKRLFDVATDMPTEYMGLDINTRQILLATKIDELNTFNKASRAVAHKIKGTGNRSIFLRKNMRYAGMKHTYKMGKEGVDVMSVAAKETVTDSADNILKAASQDGVYFTGVKGLGVDSPYVEIPIPAPALVAAVPEELATGTSNILMRNVAKYGDTTIADSSRSWMQRVGEKLEDTFLLPMWRKGPNTTKFFNFMDERYMYQGRLTSEFAEKYAKRPAQIIREMPTKLRKQELDIGGELLTQATINRRSYRSIADATADLNKAIPDNSWRYYKAEAESVYHLHRQAGELSLMQQGYYKMNPKDPKAMEIMAGVQEHVRKANETFYIPMTQNGKYIVMRKALGAAPEDFSSGSNDMITVCRTHKEAVAAAKRMGEMGGKVEISSNVARYQTQYFYEFPTPDMLESVLERGGYSKVEIQNMLDTMNKLKGKFGLIGRRIENGFDTSKMGLQIQEWSDRIHKSMSKANYDKDLADLVLQSRGAPDGNYVAEMLSRLNMAGGDAFAGARTFFYGWHLGGKLGFYLQNMTQGYLYTLPECVRHEGFVQGARTWKDAWRYMRYFNASPEKKLKLVDTITDPYVKSVLGKLSAKGKLGAGMTQEWMHAQRAYGVRRLTTDLEKWVGLFGTKSEQMNRGHAAVSAILIAKRAKYSKKVAEDLAVSFINRTQFPFQAYNVPQMFVGRGNLRNAARFMYMYKGFVANSIGRALDVWGTGETRYIAAQTMAALSLYGMAGVPGYNLAKKAFMAGTGEDFESKIKSYLKNPSIDQATSGFTDYMFSKGGWKVEAGKTVLSGLPSLAGVSTATWLGLGDVPFTDIDSYLGVLNMYKIPINAYDKLSKGHGIEAVAELMPASVKNILTSYIMTKKGLVDRTGQLIYTPAMADIMRKSIGVPSLGIDETYKVRALVKTEVAKHKANVADFNYKIKEAYKAEDMKALQVVVNEVREYNREHPARPIKLDFTRLHREALERLEPTHMEGVPDWALSRLTEYERAFR